MFNAEDSRRIRQELETVMVSLRKFQEVCQRAAEDTLRNAVARLNAREEVLRIRSAVVSPITDGYLIEEEAEFPARGDEEVREQEELERRHV